MSIGYIIWLVTTHCMIVAGIVMLHTIHHNYTVLVISHCLVAFGIFAIHVVPRIPILIMCRRMKPKADK